MGLRESFSGVAASFVGLFKTRLELLLVEAAEEKARLLRVLGMAFGALLFLTLAVLVFSILVAVYFWPTENRYIALGVLAALYGVLGIVLLLLVRNNLAHDPIPFSATLSELGRDAGLLDRVRDAAAQEEANELRERELKQRARARAGRH
jgi:uncharacterized membrane protein YqjE